MDNMFNQFFLSFVQLSKQSAFDLGSYLISVLKSLKDIYAIAIISKKLIQALEVAATKMPEQISISMISSFLADKWRQVEPEALDLFVKVFALNVPIDE